LKSPKRFAQLLPYLFYPVVEQNLKNIRVFMRLHPSSYRLSPYQSFPLALLLLLGSLWIGVAEAQQTVFNVPSADVTDKQSFFYQHQSGPRFWLPGRSWTMTNNLGYGIGHHTELDATLIGLDAYKGRTGWDRDTALGLGFKTAWPILPKKLEAQELKVVVGELIPVEFSGRSVGSWSYSEVSGRVPKLNTRLTAGVNYGTKQIFGTPQFSYMLAYEQPLNRHWMLQGDWFSGTHAQSCFIPGIVYSFKSGTMLSFGYQIPNPGSISRSAFVFELTTFFKQPSFRKLHRHKPPGTKWQQVPEFDKQGEDPAVPAQPAPSAQLLDPNPLTRNFTPERLSDQWFTGLEQSRPTSLSGKV
jgi:hypothetical protein